MIRENMMVGVDLKVGDWIRCEYHGKPRMGVVEEKTYSRFHPHQDGLLVKTADGYRHFKLAKMRNIEMVR